MSPQTKRYWFTLIEILIAIVIIGILIVILIPRILGTQFKTRDATRLTDMRTISNAIIIYSADHNGSYPPAFSNQLTQWWVLLLVSTKPINSPLISATTTHEQNEGTIEMIWEALSAYLSTLPHDPAKKWIAVYSYTNTQCKNTGTSYAYYRNNENTKYAITAISETHAGNTTNCMGTIDETSGPYTTMTFSKVQWSNNEEYQTLQNTYYDSADRTSRSCFDFINGTISNYDNQCPKEVIIPMQIDQKEVTNIASNTFYGDQIISVAIPESVIMIGHNVFTNNGPGRNSNDIIDFIPNTNQLRQLEGINRIKQNIKKNPSDPIN